MFEFCEKVLYKHDLEFQVKYYFASVKWIKKNVSALALIHTY